MVADVRHRVVFVKDPSILPDGLTHEEAVERLSRANSLVLLLSHGNSYRFSDGWLLPANVRMLEYDIETLSLRECAERLRGYLREAGVQLHSRHLDFREALPLVLTGSVLVTPNTTELVFINHQVELEELSELPSNAPPTNKWDL